jgi:hypothetical protein
VLSQGSVARVIKEYMKVPAKIVGVEVCLSRRFGVPNRHQEQLRIKFEYDSDDVSMLTCPTGCLKGHGLPGPATARALQLAHEKTKQAFRLATPYWKSMKKSHPHAHSHNCRQWRFHPVNKAWSHEACWCVHHTLRCKLHSS